MKHSSKKDIQEKADEINENKNQYALARKKKIKILECKDENNKEN